MQTDWEKAHYIIAALCQGVALAKAKKSCYGLRTSQQGVRKLCCKENMHGGPFIQAKCKKESRRGAPAFARALMYDGGLGSSV